MKCQHCPVPPHLACPDAPWHCAAVAAGGEERRQAVRALAEGRAEPAPGRLDAARAVLRCPHKGPPGCSCNAFATCGLGKGRAGQVSYAECVACVTEAKSELG